MRSNRLGGKSSGYIPPVVFYSPPEQISNKSHQANASAVTMLPKVNIPLGGPNNLHGPAAMQLHSKCETAESQTSRRRHNWSSAISQHTQIVFRDRSKSELLSPVSADRNKRNEEEECTGLTHYPMHGFGSSRTPVFQPFGVNAHLARRDTRQNDRYFQLSTFTLTRLFKNVHICNTNTSLDRLFHCSK